MWILREVTVYSGTCGAATFLPLLKYIITEALPPSLIGMALNSSGSVLELAGIGSAKYRGSF